MNGNASVISALFHELDVLGVEEFCVAAGARNAPVIAALMTRKPALTLRHFFDERSAAFFALGRVMQIRKPVAVLTTSGTAVAELFPAVMEAHYQNVPLVVVTADRPSRYRGSGAPQAVEQKGIFGEYVKRSVELEPECGEWSEECGITEGVTHINVCLDEELASVADLVGSDAADEKNWRVELAAKYAVSSVDEMNWENFWADDASLVVLASSIHPEDVPLAREFILQVNAPVIAEATSNLLGDASLGALLLNGGEKALSSIEAKRVLRLGSVPSWRWWRDLDARDDVSVLSISRAPFRGLARSQNVSVVPWAMIDLCRQGVSPCSDVSTEGDTPSLRGLTGLLESLPNSEAAWMRHLSDLIPAGATVFLGNSLPIREWNLAAANPKHGTRFFANRGANGIDGLVSTWLGVSAEAAESWLIAGDLSTLYDLSAPWILPQLKQAKRRIIVINNGGGMIFSRVGWLGALDDNVRSVIENRHSLGFESWARMWSLSYRLITDWRDLRDDDSECSVWEIRPSAEETAAFWEAWKSV